MDCEKIVSKTHKKIENAIDTPKTIAVRRQDSSRVGHVTFRNSPRVSRKYRVTGLLCTDGLFLAADRFVGSAFFGVFSVSVTTLILSSKSG